MTAPTSNVIPFVKRRKRPRVCIGIKASMCDTGSTVEQLCLIAVNDQQCGEVT